MYFSFFIQLQTQHVFWLPSATWSQIQAIFCDAKDRHQESTAPRRQLVQPSDHCRITMTAVMLQLGELATVGWTHGLGDTSGHRGEEKGKAEDVGGIDSKNHSIHCRFCSWC